MFIMFAKVTSSNDDQILAMIQAKEDGSPEVRIYFEPIESGVCSYVKQEWDEDTEENWKSARRIFTDLDEEAVRREVLAICEEFDIKMPDPGMKAI